MGCSVMMVDDVFTLGRTSSARPPNTGSPLNSPWPILRPPHWNSMMRWLPGGTYTPSRTK
jgi:hypothetical protein